MSFDPESYKLAEHFLAESNPQASEASTSVKSSLAQAIQDAVEDWFAAGGDPASQS